MKKLLISLIVVAAICINGCAHLKPVQVSPVLAPAPPILEEVKFTYQVINGIAYWSLDRENAERYARNQIKLNAYIKQLEAIFNTYEGE